MNFIELVKKHGWQKAREMTKYTKEPETIAWICSFSDTGTFWDIGANIGIYTFFCADCHPGMKILAFEPMNTNLFYLTREILQNHYANVEAYFVAFGDTNRDAKFNPGNSVVGSSGGQVGDAGYPIPMICGDWLAGADAKNVPTYIKIDTDGNEYDILLGMPGVLHSPKLKGLLVEINNHQAQIFEMMDNAGLKLDREFNALKDRKSDMNVIFTRK